MKKIILSIALIIFVFCGCTGDEKNAATGHKCVNCGADATHFAGSELTEDPYNPTILYLCDKCYNDKISTYKKQSIS